MVFWRGMARKGGERSRTDRCADSHVQGAQEADGRVSESQGTKEKSTDLLKVSRPTLIGGR